mgnify:CR=1 FL=1
MPIDIAQDLKKYIPIFQQASEQNLNEAETSLRIGKLLEDVLGYYIFKDITKEHTIKDRYVDYAIKVDGKVVFFIEIKQAGIDLREKHIEQASNYAANAGVSWVALTNGRCWQLYHLSFDDGIQSDLIWSADILSDDFKDAASKISYLHKKSITKKEHEAYFEKIKALSPKGVVQAIFQESILKAIRLHLKRKSGILIDEEDVVSAIKSLISQDAWDAIGEVKVKRKRKLKKEEVPPAPASIEPAPST